MSKLIDDICRSDNPIVLDENDDWWIAKPSGKMPLAHRIKDAYRVLVGKSFACHYKQDEKNTAIEVQEAWNRREGAEKE